MPAGWNEILRGYGGLYWFGVEYSRIGVLGVDMESTALMTVAAYRKVKLAIVAAISDELYGERWEQGFGTKKLRRTEKITVEAVLKTITQYN